MWRTDQSQHLLMNTVASQITVFTDDSARIGGPIEPGPSLYEWAQSLALLGDPADTGPTLLAEAARLGPDSYPTRAFYGRYLRDCFQRIVAGAPAHVEIRVHRSRAVAMADTHGVPGGPQGIRLDNGIRLNDLDAVVLAQGHVSARLTAREARTASLARIHHLTYITPANPADVDLSGIQPGQHVLLRGLGLNFFDHMALLTVGRGGRFVRQDGRLVYRRSGSEPKLYAGSRRGVPYHARGENEKGATGRYFPRCSPPRTSRCCAALRRRTAGHFGADLWPLIAREVESVYYATLLSAQGRGEHREEFTEQFLRRTRRTSAARCSTPTASPHRSAGTGSGSPAPTATASSPAATTSPAGCWTTCAGTSPRPAGATSAARSRPPWTCCATCATRSGWWSTTAAWTATPTATTWRAGTPAQRVPLDRPAGLPHRGDDRADRGRRADRDRPGHTGPRRHHRPRVLRPLHRVPGGRCGPAR